MGLLAAASFELDPAVSTMGVTVRHGKVQFLYAPVFVCKCTFDELAGVLHHQVNHLVFEHVFADPADYPDSQARLIAEEVTVNEWVREPLPGIAITLAQYPELPPGEDTHTRYNRLARISAVTFPPLASSGSESKAPHGNNDTGNNQKPSFLPTADDQTANAFPREQRPGCPIAPAPDSNLRPAMDARLSHN